MPTHIRTAEPGALPSQPKAVSPRPLMLGVPLLIWALALLVIAGSANYIAPDATFDPQQQLAPF